MKKVLQKITAKILGTIPDLKMHEDPLPLGLLTKEMMHALSVKASDGRGVNRAASYLNKQEKQSIKDVIHSKSIQGKRIVVMKIKPWVQNPIKSNVWHMELSLNQKPFIFEMNLKDQTFNVDKDIQKQAGEQLARTFIDILKDQHDIKLISFFGENSILHIHEDPFGQGWDRQWRAGPKDPMNENHPLLPLQTHERESDAGSISCMPLDLDEILKDPRWELSSTEWNIVINDRVRHDMAEGLDRLLKEIENQQTPSKVQPEHKRLWEHGLMDDPQWKMNLILLACRWKSKACLKQWSENPEWAEVMTDEKNKPFIVGHLDYPRHYTLDMSQEKEFKAQWEKARQECLAVMPKVFLEDLQMDTNTAPEDSSWTTPSSRKRSP